MLRGSDIIAGKILVQMGLATADDVRAMLRKLDGDADPRWDLVNGLIQIGKLDTSAIEFVRHRSALYEHVRREAIYVRLLERETTIKKESVAKLLAQLECASFRRRLGDVLVRRGSIKPEYDQAIVDQQRESLEKDDHRILARYRKEDFAGVAKALIGGGSRLEPSEFKISTLFRSKQTRALVDKAELELLRQVARKQAKTKKQLEQSAQEDTQITDLGGTAVGEKTAKTIVMDPHAETAKMDPDEVAAAKAEAAAERERLRDAIPDATPAGPSGSQIMSTDDVRKLKRIADYSIVEVLGVGGMGAVFLGQRDGVGEYVAIKVLLNQAASEEEKGRFEREVKLTQLIQHDNVIHIIETGVLPSGVTYVVVPALAGKELRDLIEQAEGKPLNPEMTAPIFTQVLEGMQAVHDKAIVHRDIKPENVFIMAGGQHEVKLMDFGLAKPKSEKQDEINVFMTVGGEVSGSPAYMAPESVTNDPFDGRTDIYSLGVMLFEMLTGKLPLESETTQGYLTQHLISPPLTLAEARPEIDWPQELEDLLASMLGKTKDERPASCKAILDKFGAGLAVKIHDLKERATEEETLDLEAKPDMEGWGFKGLLGRLMGKA